MTSVVPRFRTIDADPRLVTTSLRRILGDARDLASAQVVTLTDGSSAPP